MRTAEFERKSNETDIRLKINLDGAGRYDVETGCGFLDHMLELFARHGRFDLAVRCEGDTRVDDHHTVEDVGIALGTAMRQALGDRRGIRRYGSAVIPMDEALVLAATDLSGRAFTVDALEIPTQKVGSFDTELVEEFLLALNRTLGASLHLRQFSGSNSHHIIEAAFKALARSLAQSVSIDPDFADEIPSTKGMLD